MTILTLWKKKEVTAFIAIDLGAALHTVDHDIIFIKHLFNHLYEFLINVLQKQYGTRRTALKWL